jgi:voltage-gated potassium channel
MARTRELRRLALRLTRLGIVVVGVLVAGTIAFSLSEDLNPWEAFRWSLDIVATVGSAAHPKTTAGEVTSTLLIVVGVGTLFYGLVTVTEFFVAGHLAELLHERRTQRMIDATSDHFIICGFGRVGRQVARDLRAAGARYVVIDPDPDNLALASGVGVRVIEGQASDDESLRRAGVERARAVVACVDSDAENIFITLTVRELRPDITIVARASEEDSEKKLWRAGANRVVSPYKASGAEMTRLALHPQIAGVVDVAPEFRLEEIEVTDGCAAAGKRIGDVRGSSYIVALRRPDGTVLPQPVSETTLSPGDVLVAMGHTGALERLEGLLAPSLAPS